MDKQTPSKHSVQITDGLVYRNNESGNSHTSMHIETFNANQLKITTPTSFFLVSKAQFLKALRPLFESEGVK